ncbi:3'(2'),5'-bisphosphate nucleotidase CysQ family protein [Undibacter mobilis]|uniref:3'(2'),5'-bisphosphate nucleotidase CysQ n=1 Tax=Undibacter mobilis TaxID=2292256 RepID=A0A371B6L0_9BRAD|nr:3'(2'),5'-bisphosphate nucleotidase CysQ [Undibacter mobilis]RDV03235.1 3'(2'),5'-bisphosphate nucleotidase CysQ [Undibacter mobilis]
MQDISPQQAERLIEEITALAARASAATLAVPFSAVEQHTKGDLSPVTAADEAAEAIILEGLERLCPGVPVVAEESVAKGRIPAGLNGSFFCVDPLDGTKEFLAGRDEFTVNIALITQGQPVAGVIAAPAQGRLWRGVVGFGATRLRLKLSGGVAEAYGPEVIHPRPAPVRIAVATSRTHLDDVTEAFIARLPVGKRYMCGSSVKFCHLAEGDADIYPRFSPTCEWDIAAGCAILSAAGGAVVTPAGDTLRFGNSAGKFRIPGFIAIGDPRGLPALCGR